MQEAVNSVKTAEVTYAVRDTELYGKTIRNGDYMGIGEGRILGAGTELTAVTLDTVRELSDDDTEMITIYYGADASEEEAQNIADIIGEELENAEVEVVYGGQPVYYYFISVE